MTGEYLLVSSEEAGDKWGDPRTVGRETPAAPICFGPVSRKPVRSAHREIVPLSGHQ